MFRSTLAWRGGTHLGHAMPSRRILHVITDLNLAGAESALARLATAEPALAEETIVVSLLADGFYAAPLRAAGVTVVELNFRTASGMVAGMIALARLMARTKPDIVQGWMYHGDLAALLALVLSGRRRSTRLAWNIRCSDLDFSRYGRVLRMVVNACVVLSRRPDLIIANSAAGLKSHEILGYRPRRTEVVPNGIDTEIYRPDAVARADVRRELAIPDDAPVVAHVARVDPMKDHSGFLRVMATLPHVHALIAGAGTESLPAAPNLHRLGRRTDIPRVLAAADLVVSSSAFGEGFSNALAEGMACGLPAAATDVGDAALIVGDTGLLVTPGDPSALAGAIRRLLEEPASQRAERGRRARARITENFSLARARQRYAEIYETLLDR